MSNVVAAEICNDNPPNKDVPEGKAIQQTLSPPPCGPLSRTLQTVPSGHSLQEGGANTPSDASVGSAPSTAPGSPRLLVIFS